MNISIELKTALGQLLMREFRPPPGTRNKRKAAPGFLIADADITFLVKRHGTPSATVGRPSAIPPSFVQAGCSVSGPPEILRDGTGQSLGKVTGRNPRWTMILCRCSRSGRATGHPCRWHHRRCHRQSPHACLPRYVHAGISERIVRAGQAGRRSARRADAASQHVDRPRYRDVQVGDQSVRKRIDPAMDWSSWPRAQASCTNTSEATFRTWRMTLNSHRRFNRAVGPRWLPGSCGVRRKPPGSDAASGPPAPCACHRPRPRFLHSRSGRRR